MLDEESLINRNNRIIEIVKRQIEEKCPDSIDLIGIGGSFCSGDYYEKSDLDLVIIANDQEKAKVLCKCFILDDIGFDIYIATWDKFEYMSRYENPYCTKLFDLDIVYTKDDSIIDKYLSYRDRLVKNMKDEDTIRKSITRQASELVNNYVILEETGDMGLALRLLDKIITNVEYIIYLINREYVKRSTKRIPEEIASMKILPSKFLDTYNIICNCDSLQYIKSGASSLMMHMDEILSSRGIEAEEIVDTRTIDEKQDINSINVRGTYEEIYSNWKNKMYHAVDINSSYLSFRTMASVQSFYDEMAEIFNIPRIEILIKYNPNDLIGNANAFDEALSKWKEFYDEVGLEIEYYKDLEDLDNLYNEEKRLQK